MAVFADATYFVALMDEDDQWHERALALLDFAQRRTPLHVHALALGEVIAIVGGHSGGKAAQRAYQMLGDTTQLHLPTREDLDGAMGLVLRYDGTLSLSDALSLHLMPRVGATQIISFDADFDGKGIERVHAPPEGPAKRAKGRRG